MSDYFQYWGMNPRDFSFFRPSIKTNAPHVEVSWQVTGVRQDAYANKNRIPVEVVKSEKERGFYLHPDAFNQPADKGVQSIHLAPVIERKNSIHEKARVQQQKQ